MNVNINNNKTIYEYGDLIELENFGFRMIIELNNKFALMNMNGIVTTIAYDSIEDLLENRTIISHYKNKDLELSLRK